MLFIIMVADNGLSSNYSTYLILKLLLQSLRPIYEKS